MTSSENIKPYGRDFWRDIRLWLAEHQHLLYRLLVYFLFLETVNRQVLVPIFTYLFPGLLIDLSLFTQVSNAITWSFLAVVLFLRLKNKISTLWILSSVFLALHLFFWQSSPAVNSVKLVLLLSILGISYYQQWRFHRIELNLALYSSIYLCLFISVLSQLSTNLAILFPYQALTDLASLLFARSHFLLILIAVFLWSYLMKATQKEKLRTGHFLVSTIFLILFLFFSTAIILRDDIGKPLLDSIGLVLYLPLQYYLPYISAFLFMLFYFFDNKNYTRITTLILSFSLIDLHAPSSQTFMRIVLLIFIFHRLKPFQTLVNK